MRLRLILPLLCVLVSAVASHARSFSVVVYNVENLFDADGVAVYDDYQPGKYTPAHLTTKLTNIVRVLQTVEKGAGPDIILFNEIEADQTPESKVEDVEKWLKKYEDQTFSDLLAQNPLSPEIAGVPSEVWLLKALHDGGLSGYRVIDGDPRRGGRLAVKCVVFSRFPVKSYQLHALQNARPIVEAELDVEGHSLFVFNNHWKSGAGDADTEPDRRANAKVLRARLNELLAKDPNSDIIVGGDLNSHYNQKARYREMRETGINDVLGAQGNELAIRGKDRDLYNLWFELPSDARGSDVFQGEWGTLMHMILSRGLYDMRGVQYEDNSFAVMKITGLNADGVGRPIRWRPYSATGSGFSDHFPLYARFRTVADNRPDRWMPLTKPNTDESGSTRQVDFAPVDLFQNARDPETVSPEELRDGSHNGNIFLVSAKGYTNERGHVKVKVRDLEYDVYSSKKTIRDRLRADAEAGKALKFYGELGVFKGNWQFIVHDKEWIK